MKRKEYGKMLCICGKMKAKAEKQREFYWKNTEQNCEKPDIQISK